MSAIPEDVRFLFCKVESSYKQVDIDINDEELYSNGIGDRISIQKLDAIDLLTEKIDLNGLDLCANFNLYYCEEPFIVKLDHFSSYIIKGICQKRDQFTIVQSDIMRNMLDRIFLVINIKLNRNAEKFN